jgi:hypothetical protein
MATVVGKVGEIMRFPIKSLLGETLVALHHDHRLTRLIDRHVMVFLSTALNSLRIKTC